MTNLPPDLLADLEAAITAAGSVRRFANERGLHASGVGAVRRGHLLPGAPLLAALGWEKVTVYRRAPVPTVHVVTGCNPTFIWNENP